MSSVVAPSAFNASKVTFSPIKMMESGGKMAFLNYDNRPLVMQVGSLETPFGLSVYDKVSPPKYTVELKLRGYDAPLENPKTAAIYNAMNALDEHMVENGVKNSRAWFKADLKHDMVKMLYTPTVRFSKDNEGNVKPYPPTLKVQLRQRDGKFETAVYDDKKRPLTDVPLEDVIVKGSSLTVLMQCTGVWFVNGKFNLTWKAIQIRADTVPESIRGFAFLEDGDAPAAAAYAAPAPLQRTATAAPAPAPKHTNQFQGLADEDEVDDEEALAPPQAEEAEEESEAPIPVPAKKTTITKKKLVVPKKA